MRHIIPALVLWTGTATAQTTLQLPQSGGPEAAPVAAGVETSLELVLLADANVSIDAGELAFQRQGYADALLSDTVQDAIADTLHGHIAVTYVEWATNQVQVVDWMLIDWVEAAQAFADALTAAPRATFGSNAIGAALLAGQRLIDTNAYDGFRHVIDFSGDSMGNSSGPAILPSRDQVLATGTVINALPILRADDMRRAGYDLEQLYADNIIGGPGAFMVTAEGRDSFAAAVQRKLVLEIAGEVPPLRLALD
ncbi:Protein of unknown function [Loktanella fryxellensis]|uniref:VWFA domain-containing protein n=1 Tax=Loktanella fryxellensis TaxID=245187 RepID=A0A1H8K7J7_9RHOB|nr:DUF1194 domain-containing protein [Loktanella fryxellensis]SEN88904.1 Protein of unknown function [Loktanella fryxellensis]